MRIGTLAESWEKYTAMVGNPPVAPPPESIFVWDGDELIAGCCIYPCADSGIMFVTRTSGIGRGLSFLLQILRAHSTVTSRHAVIEFEGRFEVAGVMPLSLYALSADDYVKRGFTHKAGDVVIDQEDSPAEEHVKSALELEVEAEMAKDETPAKPRATRKRSAK